jgi:hypothetical protein
MCDRSFGTLLSTGVLLPDAAVAIAAATVAAFFLFSVARSLSVHFLLIIAPSSIITNVAAAPPSGFDVGFTHSPMICSGGSIAFVPHATCSS